VLGPAAVLGDPRALPAQQRGDDVVAAAARRAPADGLDGDAVLPPVAEVPDPRELVADGREHLAQADGRVGAQGPDVPG